MSTRLLSLLKPITAALLVFSVAACSSGGSTVVHESSILPKGQVHFVAVSRLTSMSHFHRLTSQEVQTLLNSSLHAVKPDITVCPQITTFTCTAGGGGTTQVNRYTLGGDNFADDYGSGNSNITNSTSQSVATGSVDLTGGNVSAYYANIAQGGSVPVVPVESIPTNEWVALYDAQVYLSSDLVTAYYKRADGESAMFKFNSSTNAVDIYDLSNGGDSFAGSIPLSDLSNWQYAYNAKGTLEAACALGYAGVLAVATAAGFGIYGSLQSGWIMNAFGPVCTSIYVASAVVSAGLGAYGAYKALCPI